MKDDAVPFELQSLTEARRYQKWVAEAVSPYLGERTLELGAGIGTMTAHLPVGERLIASEADPTLFKIMESRLSELVQSRDGRVCLKQIDLSTDWIAELKDEKIDTVVSFNVMEHVEDHEKALSDLVTLLRQSGAPGKKRIVTFVPAHQWAYGTLDKIFGHHRRYSARAFERLAKQVAPNAKVTTRYFNVFGLPGWVAIGKIFRRKEIGMGAVKSFEKIVPWVKDFDDFIHIYLKLPLGQSLLSVIELES